MHATTANGDKVTYGNRSTDNDNNNENSSSDAKKITEQHLYPGVD